MSPQFLHQIFDRDYNNKKWCDCLKLEGKAKTMETFFALFMFCFPLFAIAETLLLVKEKKGLKFECLVAGVLWLLFTTAAYFYRNFTSPESDWATESRLVDFALMNGVSFSMVFLVLLLVNQFITNIEERGSMHVLLFGIMVIIVPFWAFGHFMLFCIMVYCM